MDTTPEAFTFAPTILGDKRAGKFLKLFRRNMTTTKDTEHTISTTSNGSKFVYIDIAFGDDQKYRVTLKPDSDPEAIADEFARSHGLSDKLRASLAEQFKANIEKSFGTAK